MSRRVLEINDVELTVADASRVRVRSPGQVVCDDDAERGGLLAGDAAVKQRRINPRATYDRFWAWLDRKPLPRPAGQAQCHADLAWFHLREVLREDAVEDGPEDGPGDWLLAVPAELDDEQLALLLGIAQNLGLSVAGMVAAPVAAAAASGAAGNCVVLDTQWHRFSAVAVARDAGRWRLQSAVAPGGKGFAELMDAWAALVSEAFIAQTRFDPGHDANSEQELYNRLPEWLDQLDRGAGVAAELTFAGHHYRATLEPQPFVEAAEPFYRPLLERIEQSGDCDVVVRHRLAGLPGLLEALRRRAAGEVIGIDEQAVAAHSLERADSIAGASPSGGVHYACELPVAAEAAAAPAQDGGHPPAPSHVLIDGRAVPIGGAGLALSGGSGHWRLAREDDGRVWLTGQPEAAAEVNGEPAGERAALAAGDRVSLGGRDYLLLQVEGNGSA